VIFLWSNIFLVQWLALTVVAAFIILKLGKAKALVSLNGVDVSYGIYIYAFPVQQCIASILSKDISPWLHVGLRLAACCRSHFFRGNG